MSKHKSVQMLYYIARKKVIVKINMICIVIAALAKVFCANIARMKKKLRMRLRMRNAEKFKL